MLSCVHCITTKIQSKKIEYRKIEYREDILGQYQSNQHRATYFYPPNVIS